MADPAQLQRSAYLMFFQQLGVAEAAITAENFAYLEGLWRQWSPGWAIDAEALATLKAQFAQPGVPTATLPYYRQAFETATPIAQAGAALFAAPLALPTLGLYGAQDGCIAADVFERAMRAEDFPGGLSLQRLEACGHFLHLEDPLAVNQALIAFFRRHA